MPVYLVLPLGHCQLRLVEAWQSHWLLAKFQTPKSNLQMPIPSGILGKVGTNPNIKILSSKRFDHWYLVLGI
jgi:hypothetical protein